MRPYPHPRGDTVSLAGSLTLPAGDWTATSQMRKLSNHPGGAVVAEFTVTLTPPVAPATKTGVLLEYPADQQADWAPERHICDIRFADATGVVKHTRKFLIDVEAPATEVPAP